MRILTLTPEKDKKVTSAEIYATPQERKALAKLIREVRERLIFDKDSKRTKGNVRAIQAAPDETGKTMPFMYIKLDNFLKKFGDAIETGATSVDLGFEPNEFSRETGDAKTNDLYSATLSRVLRSIGSHLVRGTNGETADLWPGALWKIKGVFDLAQMEGITSGEDLSVSLKKGKTIPEYGVSEIPPADRWYGLKGSTKRRSNRGFLVIVEDESEEGLTRAMETPLKIRNYSNLVKNKIKDLKGLGPTILNAYREDKKLKPKNKIDLLEMAVAFTVGMSEGIVAPRPILKPKKMRLEDPDKGDQQRMYYGFTISGHSGARGMAMRPGTEAALTGVSRLDVED